MLAEFVAKCQVGQRDVEPFAFRNVDLAGKLEIGTRVIAQCHFYIMVAGRQYLLEQCLVGVVRQDRHALDIHLVADRNVSGKNRNGSAVHRYVANPGLVASQILFGFRCVGIDLESADFTHGGFIKAALVIIDPENIAIFLQAILGHVPLGRFRTCNRNDGDRIKGYSRSFVVHDFINAHFRTGYEIGIIGRRIETDHAITVLDRVGGQYLLGIQSIKLDLHIDLVGTNA